MKAHIQKWGNSLGLRIPGHIAKQLKLHLGGVVSLEITKDNQLMISTPNYELGKMVQEITPENKHHTLLEDKPQGNEAW